MLARYHFVARMLQGHNRVLEVGCGDGTGAPIVAKAVGFLCGIDINPDMVRQASKVVHALCADILDGPLRGAGHFTAAYALDVLEHIPEEQEHDFLCNIKTSLVLDNSVLIIGSPSLESQPYASEPSRCHVNCKTEDGLRALLGYHFRNVFLFGMNDATLHAGFGPMCHYRLAICTDPK